MARNTAGPVGRLDTTNQPTTDDQGTPPMNPRTILARFPHLLHLLALAVLAGAGLFAYCLATDSWPHLSGLVTLATFGAVIGARDAALKVTRALPNGAATVYSDGIDLGYGTLADKRGLQLLIEAPALVVGDLANGDTMTYTVQHDSDENFGTAADLHASALVQTGAGGTGAAAATKRVALPDNCSRYLRVKVVNSGAGDASDKTATVSLQL